MSFQRRSYRLRTSWVVALPREVRAHLGMKGGEPVYWHIVGPGEAALSLHDRRVGGRPSTDRLAHALDLARQREERLVRRLAQQPEATRARAENQGYMRALKHLGFGPQWVAEVRRLLEDVRAEVKWIGARARAERHHARHARGQRRRTPPGTAWREACEEMDPAGAAARADAHPSAPPPSSPVESDGGDAASGAAPPGRPAE